jgi:hypothetical protein
LLLRLLLLFPFVGLPLLNGVAFLFLPILHRLELRLVLLLNLSTLLCRLRRPFLFLMLGL